MSVVIVVVLGTTGTFYLYFLENSLRNSIYYGLESIADTSSQVISRFLDDTQREAEAVALALDKKALEERDIPKIEEKLREMLEIFPKFQNGMFLLDKDAKLWVDYPQYQKTRGVDLSFREYFKRTMKEQKGIIGVPYRSVRTGNPVLTFTALLRGTSDQVLGLIGCSVQLNSPLALEGIRQTKISESGYIYVFDTTRLIILHPRNERILKRDVKPGANRLFDAAIEGFEGVGETVNSAGIPMLISFKHVPETNWIIGAQQQQSEAFAPIRAAREQIIYGIITALFMTVLVVSIVIRGITGPILKLRRAARLFNPEKAGSGDGEYRKELESIRRGDEIGDLAVAFTDVCDRLDKTMLSLKASAIDWERTFNSVSDAIFILDRENKITRLNRSAVSLINMEPEDAVGQSFYKLIHGVDQPDYYPGMDNLLIGNPHRIEFKGLLDHTFKLTLIPLVNESGDIVGTVSTVKDITAQKHAVVALRQREQELETKSKKLEEANIALKVLLKHKDDHEIELEERVVHNIKKLALPYIENLKKGKLDFKQATYLDIIEKNLNEIISPASKRLSSKYFNLTAREIQVANLIKDSKTNKDIAGLLNISLRTIEYYRENIRRKIGLTNKRINLKTYLLNLKS